MTSGCVSAANRNSRKMKFSIIIPVYNVAPYLRECLRSVIAASDELKAINDKWSTEIICIDDCSTDGSGEILDELSAVYHSSLIVHHLPANAGVSAARNRGLDEVTGEWFLFVDADDLIAPDWLANVAARIEQDPEIDLWTYGLDKFDETGSLGGMRVIDPFGCAFCQSVYRRSVYGGVRFPPYGIGEDRVFSFRCLAKSQRQKIVSQVAYHYRMRQSSAMHTKRTYRMNWHSLRHEIDLFVEMLKIRHMPLRWRLRTIGGIYHGIIRLIQT